MFYLLLAFIALFIAVSLLRLRLRFEFSPQSRILFIGLGHSGPQVDFIRKEGMLRICGLNLGRFAFGRRKEKLVSARERRERLGKPPKKAKRPRTRPARDIVRVGRQCLHPAWHYAVGLLRSTVVEELHGRVEGGFGSPDVTGMAYGYYQAALAAVPQLVARVDYIPVWVGPFFNGSGKIAVALPLYKLVGRTVQLLWRLPLREIIKLAIGNKQKGESDVQ